MNEFIKTTHSPIPLVIAPEDELIVVSDNRAMAVTYTYEKLYDCYGQEIENISYWMVVSPKDLL